MSQKIGDIYVELGARIDKLEQGLKTAESRTSSSANKMEKGMSSAFAKIGIAAAAAFSVDRVISFASEAVKLAGELEGIERAFNQLNEPGLLDNLREATQGTVSDMELMRKAVQANNFKLPLNQLASLFEFATKRAAQTGESVDYLVNSIVTGIGRKSPLILDNLGISAVSLREKLGEVGMETASVGDIAAAVGAIATEELGKMGDGALTTAQKTQALQAQLQNVTIEVGEKLTPAWNGMQEAAVAALDNVNILLSESISKSTKFALALAYLQGNAAAVADAITEAAVETNEYNKETERAAKSQEALNAAVQLGLIGEEHATRAKEGLTRVQATILSQYRDQILAQIEKNKQTQEEVKVVEQLTKKYTQLAGEIQKTGIGTVSTGIQTTGISRPSGQMFDEEAFNTFLEQQKMNVFLMDQAAQLSSMLGAGFAEALVNGENFGEVMEDVFRRMLTQLIAMVAQALILSAILSATGLGGGLAFGQLFRNNLLGGGGGGFQLSGFLQGSNIWLSGERGQNDRGR